MADYNIILYASRIADDQRVDKSGSDDGNVTGWDKFDEFILCTAFHTGSKAARAFRLKLQWRDVTDSGSFADVGLTGEIKYVTSDTVLSDDTDVTSGERRCSSYGDTWQNGRESENDNLSPDSGTYTLAEDYETEFQWALDCSGADDEHEYAFQIIDVQNSVTIGTCGCTLTIKAAAVTHYGACTMSGTGSVSAIGKVTATGVMTMAGSGSMAVIAQNQCLAACTMTGSGAMSVNGRATHTGVAAMAGSGAMSCAAQNQCIATVTMSGVGSVAVIGTIETGEIVTGAATMSGTGSVTVNGRKTATGVMTMAGSGAAVINGRITATGVMAMSGSGAVVVIAQNECIAVVAMSGSGSVVVAAAVTHTGVCTMAGSGAVAVIAQNECIAVVAMSGVGSVDVIGTVTTGQTVTGVVTMSGVGSVSVAGSFIRAALCSMSGTGSVSIIAQNECIAVVAMSGSGSMSVLAQSLCISTLTMTGVGLMSVIGTLAVRAATGLHAHDGYKAVGIQLVRLAEIPAAPPTPDTGFVYMYAKTDGKVYIKDDTGTETDLTVQ